jgi:hypothetical protein
MICKCYLITYQHGLDIELPQHWHNSQNVVPDSQLAMQSVFLHLCSNSWYIILVSKVTISSCCICIQ